MNPILNQLNAWRQRFKPKPTEENLDLLNGYFAQALGSVAGREVVDYLITTYFKPIEFIGATDSGRMFERNGQQIMLVDILTRIDMGLHPQLYKESPATEQPYDVRA